MEEAETEVGGEGGVDRAVDRAKVKDELVRAKVALGTFAGRCMGGRRGSGGWCGIVVEDLWFWF